VQLCTTSDQRIVAVNSLRGWITHSCTVTLSSHGSRHLLADSVIATALYHVYITSNRPCNMMATCEPITMIASDYFRTCVKYTPVSRLPCTSPPAQLLRFLWKLFTQGASLDKNILGAIPPQNRGTQLAEWCGVWRSVSFLAEWAESRAHFEGHRTLLFAPICRCFEIVK